MPPGATTRTPADVLAEVDALRHLTPAETAAAMGMTGGQIARVLADAGLNRRASIFRTAGRKQRRAAS